MTTPDDATRAILERGKELLAERMAALEPLAEILATRKAVEAQLASLDEEYGKRYVAAERAGWSEEELTAMDALPPTRRPRGRPAKRSATKRAAAKTTATAGAGDRDKVPGQSGPSGAESPTGTAAAAGA
ncbi:hypothetical protein ABZ851_36925 [Streptomyces sp. NPDC047049]|uniref:hypothetical protein n=1 Tax=Streptomyces sp. NPDC047049 TaxID=3156688 RepID=UPI0033D2DAA8